ncbi:hypothetical protein HD806DRAFT_178465 [Xylariaceae sp. AK1471]|nr:hypothetical protein HD806DRAFT_178465 [Xylariaceae sp. AK1471]
MTQEHSLPTAGEYRNEVSPAESSSVMANTSRGTATQPAGELDQVEETTGPPLPQRPAHTQPLPQPFHGQHQQMPYAQHPALPNQQQLIYATPMRPLPKQSQAYIATKLGLTALSSVWGIIIIALTSILLSEGGYVGYVALYSYAIVVASIIWNTSELITYCARLRKDIQRGIHPGAHVALHLIFWLAGILAILLTVSIYLETDYDVRRCEEDNGDYDLYSDYYNCGDVGPTWYYKGTILPVLRAHLAIFVLWLINHFVLFVFACIDTHKRNVLKAAAFIMPIPAGSKVAPGQGMYYPQQPGMQPMQYYPYPVMMQPQAPGAPGAGPQSVSNENQPSQPSQNFTGFYAPASGPVASSSQIQQPPPAQMASGNVRATSPAQNVGQAQ